MKTHISPYLVAAAGHLRHVGSNLVELTAFKPELDEFKEKVLGLEEEKCMFKECYDLFPIEKVSIEDQVTRLDAEVERLSQQDETLMENKKVLDK